MVDLGRFQLGDFITFRVPTYRSNDLRTRTPDAAPTIKTFAAGSLGSAVETATMYTEDTTTNSFVHHLHLDSSYSAGVYVAFMTWATDSATYNQTEAFKFEIVAGGDADGAVIAATHFDGASYDGVVYMTESGKLLIGKDPR